MVKRGYIKKNKLFITIIIILLIIFIILISHRYFTRLVLDIHKKVTYFTFYSLDSLISLKYLYMNKNSIGNLNKRVLLLETENQQLKAENRKLYNILKLKENLKLKNIKCYASVIGANNDGFIYYYLIDKGKNDGVEEGDGVIADGYVLGRIINTYDAVSKIQLLTDEKSSISIKNERTNVVGILSGKGYNQCLINYVPKEEDMAVGDIILTSSLGKSFPEGIKVGVITEVNKKVDALSMFIKIKPFVDIFTISEVAIISR